MEKYNIKLHYIETKLNSADLLTKEFDKVYHEIPLWTSGPPNIREIKFPVFKEIDFELESGNPDTNIYVNVVTSDTSPLSRIKNVSSLNSLFKITHILRNAATTIFSHRLKDNQGSNPKLPIAVKLKNGPRLCVPEITPSEINSLFFVWIKYLQSIYF